MIVIYLVPCRDHFGYGLSQWEIQLQCKVIDVISLAHTQNDPWPCQCWSQYLLIPIKQYAIFSAWQCAYFKADIIVNTGNQFKVIYIISHHQKTVQHDSFSQWMVSMFSKKRHLPIINNSFFLAQWCIWCVRELHSLAPGRFKWNFRQLIFNLILVTDCWGVLCGIVLMWLSLDLTHDKPTSLQVMAWCRQAASHYLSQCWPRYVSPYGVTRPQWVNHHCF